MNIGERIKQRRIELGLSQEEVATRVGYKSRSSINKIELSRSLPLSKIETMAIALNCKPSYLMGWDDLDGEPNNPSFATKLGLLVNDRDFEHLTDVYLSIPDDKKSKAVSIFEDMILLS